VSMENAFSLFIRECKSKEGGLNFNLRPTGCRR